MTESQPPLQTADVAKQDRRPAGPELRRTQTIAGAALLLTVLAAVSAPRNPEPSDFVDLGERFFPNFEDPEEAMSLEVIEFDEATAEAIPFRVQNERGIWTIPSHHDYPADGKDRLAQTAAGVMLLEKDDFRSDNVADHPSLGVVDPLDEGAVSLVGRGRRVTVHATGDRVLADLIIGRQVADREGSYFVRVPGQKRVYVSRLGVDLSAQFGDWIERDLLLMDRNRVDDAVLEDYTINERTLQVDRRGRLALSKEDGEWTAEGLGSDEEVDSFGVNELLRTADELEIVGVRPKPEGIAATLTGDAAGVSNADILSLQSRGYYLTQGGNLLSNEGEVRLETDEGILYTLRFGEVIYGRDEDVSAGSEEEDTEAAASSGPAENRYLFVTAEFQPERFPEPPRPANRDYQDNEDRRTNSPTRTGRFAENRNLARDWDRWQDDVTQGRELEETLTRRFADWYYVISQDSFENIRKTRDDLSGRPTKLRAEGGRAPYEGRRPKGNAGQSSRWGRSHRHRRPEGGESAYPNREKARGRLGAPVFRPASRPQAAKLPSPTAKNHADGLDRRPPVGIARERETRADDAAPGQRERRAICIPDGLCKWIDHAGFSRWGPAPPAAGGRNAYCHAPRGYGRVPTGPDRCPRPALKSLGFSQHPFSKCRVKRRLGHHVHAPPQQFLNIHQQRAQRQSGPAGRQSHEQVNITEFLRVGVATRHGTEHPYLPETVPFREGADLGPPGFDEIVHVPRRAPRPRARGHRKCEEIGDAGKFRIVAPRTGPFGPSSTVGTRTFTPDVPPRQQDWAAYGLALLSGPAAARPPAADAREPASPEPASEESFEPCDLQSFHGSALRPARGGLSQP